MTDVLGFIRVPSKWNCPLVRGIGKGFVKDAVTSTSSPTFISRADACRTEEILLRIKFTERNPNTISNHVYLEFNFILGSVFFFFVCFFVCFLFLFFVFFLLKENKN